MKQSILAITFIVMFFFSANAFGDEISVVPSIKANGSNGPITITPADDLSIEIQLTPGGFAGDHADWWLVAATPFGLFHYQPVDGLWIPDLTFSHQGPLFNLGEFEVLNISGLPAGSYTLYFGIDMLMNGSLDMDQAYYDSVTVNIQSHDGITIKGNITNLDEAEEYINLDAYLQLVKVEDGSVGFSTDGQGRFVYTSDLDIIDIPSSGPFSFELSSLDPGEYVIALQLLDPGATPFLAETNSKLVFIEIPDGYTTPLEIDLGDVFISLP